MFKILEVGGFPNILTLQYDQGHPSRECQRALAPLVFWSRSLKKAKKVSKISKSKSRCSKWHQLFLPSLGANELALLIYA